MIGMSEIMAGCCLVYDMTIGDMRDINRRSRIARPRQIAMYLCRELTDRSLPEIGQYFLRDHTTVLHAHRSIAKMICYDEQFAREVAAIASWLGDGNDVTEGAAATAIAEGLATFSPNIFAVERVPGYPVIPSVIFAARHSSFEFSTATEISRDEAKALCFALLPMRQNGWSYDQAVVRYMRQEWRGITRYSIWCVSKINDIPCQTSDFGAGNGSAQCCRSVPPTETPSAASLSAHQFSEAAE